MNIRLQNQLVRAIDVANIAHVGQVDKSGMPYILHPLHLMNQVLPDLELACIAVLHDVIEDSDYTIGDLVDLGFIGVIIGALHLLTHIKGEPYDIYIKKIKQNEQATRIKIEDLRHNSDITRLKGVTHKDMERMQKYHKSYIYLMN